MNDPFITSLADVNTERDLTGFISKTEDLVKDATKLERIYGSLIEQCSVFLADVRMAEAFDESMVDDMEVRLGTDIAKRVDDYSKALQKVWLEA